METKKKSNQGPFQDLHKGIQPGNFTQEQNNIIRKITTLDKTLLENNKWAPTPPPPPPQALKQMSSLEAGASCEMLANILTAEMVKFHVRCVQDALGNTILSSVDCTQLPPLGCDQESSGPLGIGLLWIQMLQD